MIDYGLTVKNILHAFPDILKEDEKLYALASIVAELLADRPGEIDRLRVYPQIENLPESLLDILAYDFKVDWYGYNFSLGVKRAQIKDSFSVHRTLGTKASIEKALSDIYPGTEMDEWFDYGGDPYYFRVLLDVTDQQVSISHDEIVRTINLFKPIRSHLQDNSVIFRSRCEIVIGVGSGYVVYGTRLCGTYPVIATQGGIKISGIEVDTDIGGVAYSAPKCGTAPGSLM